MKYLPTNWRPISGSAKHLAKIEQLEGIIAQREATHAAQVADLTERIRDAEEGLTISAGLKAKLAERQAFILRAEADIRALDTQRAELEAEISSIARSVSAQAVTIAASAGLESPLNIEGGEETKQSLHAQYTELKASNPRKASEFWARHHEQIVSEIQNA